MRLRITFSKSAALRYSGHLDLQTTWERTVRRAGLPLAYTHGFHPGPRIQIASALPLGFIGRAEIVDIWLQEPEEHSGDNSLLYEDVLQRAAPHGLTILSAVRVDEAGPALQTQVVAAEYEITLLDPVDESELGRRLSAIGRAGTLPRRWKGRAYDLRPLIEELILCSSTSQTGAPQGGGREVQIHMRLSARQGATARPEEVLDVLAIPLEATRIERTRLIFRSEVG